MTEDEHESLREQDHYTHSGPTNPDRAQWPLISIAAMLFLAMGSGGILIGGLLKGQSTLEGYHLETVGSRLANVEKRQDDFVREMRDSLAGVRTSDAALVQAINALQVSVAQLSSHEQDISNILNYFVPKRPAVLNDSQLSPPDQYASSVEGGAVVMFQGIER